MMKLKIKDYVRACKCLPFDVMMTLAYREQRLTGMKKLDADVGKTKIDE